MGTHVIVGAGPIGSATATLLASQGHEVVVVTRSGSGPEAPGIERRAADATNATTLTNVAKGASVLYNCANPAYHRWAEDWPPLATSLLEAAASTGAVLATVSNLYAYGPVTGPMTEDLPLVAPGAKAKVRAQMFAEALSWHEAGRLQMTEVRGSDYYGPGLTFQSHLGERCMPGLLAGKGLWVLPALDAVHTWTYAPDVARLLVTVAADPRGHGRAWHVPSAPPLSITAAIAQLAEAAGVAVPKVHKIPSAAMAVLGMFSPMVRELRETRYQFEAPYVLDSSAATATFGLEATTFADGASATVEFWQQRLAQGV